LKFQRTNEMMKTMAEKECLFLKTLNDTKNLKDYGHRHIVKLFEDFMYRDHKVMVFECMQCSLRS